MAMKIRCWHRWRPRNMMYTDKPTCYKCRVRVARKRMLSVL